MQIIKPTFFAFVALSVFLSGCAGFMGTAVDTHEPTKISALRPSPAGLETRQLRIQRSSYQQALESSRGGAGLRIVPLATSTAQGPVTPEYRLFNVRKGSVGDILGFQNSDILVAAHEYVIRDAHQFFMYLQALQKEKFGQVEIRRDGKPLLIRFDFED